jgi:hypothetical protein
MTGLLITNVVYGQQLIFRGFPVDTISISGSSGYYHFDDKGTTTGREDIYIIAYDKSTNNYFVADYKKVSILNTCRPDTSTQKTRHLIKDKGKIIDNLTLNDLLSAFNSKYIKPTFDDLGCDRKKFLSLTDESHIRKVAKAYKQDWHFKIFYSSHEENKIIFDGCQNIDTFNLFVATKFDTIGYAMVTDVWDEMNVSIKTTEKSFSFEGKYPNPFKQPWYDHSDKSNLFAAPIVNFSINKSLSLILPDKFYRKNTIELNALTNLYIKWYLQRRDIIY